MQFRTRALRELPKACKKRTSSNFFVRKVFFPSYENDKIVAKAPLTSFLSMPRNYWRLLRKSSKTFFLMTLFSSERPSSNRARNCFQLLFQPVNNKQYTAELGPEPEPSIRHKKQGCKSRSIAAVGLNTASCVVSKATYTYIIQPGA